MSELHKLCAGTDMAPLEALLRTGGVNLSSRDARGWTPLDCAAAWGRAAIVELLLELGADPHAPDLGGYTPLYRAVKAGHEEVALRLLELPRGEVRAPLNPLKAAVADLLPKDPAGLDSLLVLAAETGQIQLVQRLMEKGATSAGRRRALLGSAGKGSPCVPLLLDGQNQEVLKDALSNAILEERTEAVKILLLRGAQPSDYALRHALYHRAEFVDLLREHAGARMAALEEKMHCKHENIERHETFIACRFCDAWWPC